MARERLFRGELTGDEELKKVLSSLASDQELTGILKPALLKAAQPVVVAMQKNAPRSQGGDSRRRREAGKIPLNGTIGISFKQSGGRNTHSTSVCRVRIGPTYPDGAQAHLTEFGTVRRFARGDRRIRDRAVLLRLLGNARTTIYSLRHHGAVPAGGLNRGIMPAGHWMEKTWHLVEQQALRELKANIIEGLLHRADYLRRKHDDGK